MKKSIAVITDDFYLFEKIRLTLGELAEVRLFDDAPSGAFDLVIADADYKSLPADIRLSRHGECELSIPFTYAELLGAVSPVGGAALSISEADRCAILRGKRIKLTELEYSLLSYLIKKGAFADKEELLSRVWGGDYTEGIINVYIHYLREKLERGGEKIIICSRGKGYKIDEKYLKEGGLC